MNNNNTWTWKHETLGVKFFFYLVVWVAIFICCGVLMGDKHYAPLIQSSVPAIFLVFVLGAVSIVILHQTRRRTETFRWSGVLSISGVILLVFGYAPELVNLYIKALIWNAYVTVGETALVLTILLGLYGVNEELTAYFRRLAKEIREKQRCNMESARLRELETHSFSIDMYGGIDKRYLELERKRRIVIHLFWFTIMLLLFTIISYYVRLGVVP